MNGFRYSRNCSSSSDLHLLEKESSAFRLLSMLDSGPFANTLCV